MAYELIPGEGFASGVRRIAREEVEGAIELLADGVDDPSSTVHEARKQLKRTRAALRLARPALPDRAFRAENLAYRDAGRRLGPARQAAVGVLTAERLDQRLQSIGKGSVDEGLVGALRARRERMLTGAVDPGGACDEARARLETARPRIDAWPVASESVAWARRGLRGVYEKGRKRMRRAMRDWTPSRFHAWRKSVGHLWYQLVLLEPLSPAAIAPAVERAHRLSDLLGDANDLADFAAFVRGDATPDPAPEHVIGVAAAWREELWSDALELGAEVYAMKPDAFVDGLGLP